MAITRSFVGTMSRMTVYHADRLVFRYPGGTQIPPYPVEPTIPAGERPQTHALDRAATGTGCEYKLSMRISCK